jgi:phage terminase large subunit-like protein
MASSEITLLRKRAREDLLVFAVEVLGMTKLRDEVHRPWAELAMDWTIPRKLYLMPRGSMKSSLLVVAQTLWILIQNREVIPGTVGRDAKILICSDSSNRAVDLLREIKRHISRNRLFNKLFGNLKDRSLWAAEAINISTRRTADKTPSVTTAGIGTELTGAHFSIIMPDDVEASIDRDSAAARKITRQFYNDLVPLLDEGGMISTSGTYWSPESLYLWIQNDLNAELLALGEMPYKVLLRSAEEDGTFPFQSIGLTEKRLRVISAERGSADYSAQYLLRPISRESQIFSEEDFEYVDEIPIGENYMAIDPALGKSSKSDWSVCAVLTLAADGLYLADLYAEKVPVSTLRKVIVSKVQQFRPVKIAFEAVAAFDILAGLIEADLRDARMPQKIKRVHNHLEKVSRIQSAESQIKSLLIPRSWRSTMAELNQLFQFPLNAHDDVPDCLEMACSLLDGGLSKAQMQQLTAANKNAVHRTTGALVGSCDRPKNEKRQNVMQANF